MADAAQRAFGGRVRAGLIITVPSEDASAGPFPVIVASHPTPDESSERAGREALRLAGELAADERLIVLLSGGASALMASPAAGITLDQKRATTRQLLSAGADIYALNTVRKHLSAIKGGWLAARARGRVRTFAISDVIGDDLSVIGSGPTVPDATTFADALEVVQRFGGDAAFPPVVVERLRAGATRTGVPEETPKPGDRRLEGALMTVVGGRREAMDGAVREAASRGYHVVREDEAVVGEARAAGPALLRAAVARAAAAGRPACFVSSGETTVRVVGNGRGGRNQELVLACVEAIDGIGGEVLVSSVGTDGIDGPTDAAGAVADTTSLTRARQAGLVPRLFLERNDAWGFFGPLGDLINTGPTGTNVGDLQVILLA